MCQSPVTVFMTTKKVSPWDAKIIHDLHLKLLSLPSVAVLTLFCNSESLCSISTQYVTANGALQTCTLKHTYSDLISPCPGYSAGGFLSLLTHKRFVMWWCQTVVLLQPNRISSVTSAAVNTFRFQLWTDLKHVDNFKQSAAFFMADVKVETFLHTSSKMRKHEEKENQG